ncbi:MAG: hypothetical protein L6U99_05875 [Clostridium sp.]|nr:MAG: hypothetical protein L6U99_05875 [Clostridium sp.]
MNSSNVSFDNETRMRLAFDPDFPDDKAKINFSPTNFLVKFANYGLSKIYENYNVNDLSFYFKYKKNKIDEMMMKDYSDVIAEIDKEIDEFDNIK